MKSRSCTKLIRGFKKSFSMTLPKPSASQPVLAAALAPEIVLCQVYKGSGSVLENDFWSDVAAGQVKLSYFLGRALRLGQARGPSSAAMCLTLKILLHLRSMYKIGTPPPPPMFKSRSLGNYLKVFSENLSYFNSSDLSFQREFFCSFSLIFRSRTLN